jgi:N-methylhydantoinase B
MDRTSAVVNFSNNPIEIVESEYPLIIERYGYVPGSAGAGKFRGGLALLRQYRFLADARHPATPHRSACSSAVWVATRP